MFGGKRDPRTSHPWQGFLGTFASNTKPDTLIPAREDRRAVLRYVFAQQRTCKRTMDMDWWASPILMRDASWAALVML